MDKLLSLCMIVRDEEKVLKRCLESVQGLVDEIIIMDTGSIDKTKEIALSYTDKVFDFVWINDFSAAKNEAIRKATSKWILVLDADEYLARDNFDEQRNYLKSLDSTKPITFNITIYNYVGSVQSNDFSESSAVRLFPNSPDIIFERAIHEQVVSRSRKLVAEAYWGIKIFHTGYTTETRKEKNKSQRNLQLFDILKKERGFTDYDYYTLGNEHSALGDYKKALYYYKRAYTKRSQHQLFTIHCLDRMINTLIRLNQLREAMDLINEGLQRWAGYSDYYCLKAIIYDAMGYSDEAISLYKKAMLVAENPIGYEGVYWITSPNYGGIIPFRCLVRIYRDSHDIPNTIFYLTKQLTMDNSNSLALYQLLQLLVQSESLESVINFINQLYPQQTKGQWMRLLNVSLLIGNQVFAEYCYSQCLLSEVKLNSYQEMMMAFINHDQVNFDKWLEQGIEPSYQNEKMQLLYLAALVWDTPDKYTAYITLENSEDADVFQLKQATFSCINNPKTDSDFDINFIIGLLKELFKYGYYEAYDSLTKKFPYYEHVMAHLLGDHFFNENQIKLAMDYYSILLEKDELLSKGYENISGFYLADNEIEDGLIFLRKAIELNPEKAQLYPLFFKYCVDPVEKKHMLEKYKTHHAQYYSLSTPLI